MDFMKLLKSIEELLYEVVTWLIFYPLTVWRIVRHPIKTLTYAQAELTDKEEDQFDDAVSPPILLLLTLAMLHLVESTLDDHWGFNLPVLLQDNGNLLIFRALLFSLFPLLYACAGLRMRGSRLTRTTLKPAFYSQSYATVPFVVCTSVAMQMIGPYDPIVSALGWGGLFVGLLWYLAVQIIWLSRISGASHLRAATWVLSLFLVALVLLILSVLLLVGAATSPTDS